jgi:hypothetical protein
MCKSLAIYLLPVFCDTICIYAMRFEWDERKNRLNQRKHEGISFELAMLAFEDERRVISLDRIVETGEQRWLALGAVSTDSSTALIVLVAHVYREDLDGEEIVRIISARRAGKNDVRRYQEQGVD